MGRKRLGKGKEGKGLGKQVGMDGNREEGEGLNIRVPPFLEEDFIYL